MQALPTLYLCVLYLSQNKQRNLHIQRQMLVRITVMKSVYCAVRTGSLKKSLSFAFKGSISLPLELVLSFAVFRSKAGTEH